MSLRAALYLRISKDDAQTGLAVERQREECLKVIERENLDLVETYTDNGVSAYARKVRRPQFDRMTADYAAGKFDVVVCWDLDRFSRQPAQLEQWIELGEARGLILLTPTERADLGTDNGRLIARIKAATARAEVERKSVRQKAQTAQAKANGTYRARIGFDDAATVQRMFKMAQDRGLYRIAQELNADGLTTIRGNAWSGQAVKSVLTSERHRGTTVSAELYDNAQALMARGERVGAKQYGRFSGVARCLCGAAETASGVRYVCSYATNHPGSTGHVTVLRAVLDAAIDDAMILAFAFGHKSMAPDAPDLTSLDIEIAKVTANRQNVLALVAQGVAEMEEAAPQLRDLKSKLDKLGEQRTAALAESAHATMLDGIVRAMTKPGRVEFDDLAKAKAVISDRWEALDPNKRRELAREFLDVRITADRRNRVSIRHRVVETLNEDDWSNYVA